MTIQRVGKSGLFTTEDQKTYYALIKLWEEKGKPDGPTAVSIRQLAQILRKGWGEKVLKSLTESLLRLRTVQQTMQAQSARRNRSRTARTAEVGSVVSRVTG